MSTLGKILLFVNFLLAIGVLYLASQDYEKRQQLNFAALKYQIVIGGLPVEAIKDADAGDPGTDGMLVSVAGPNSILTNKVVNKKLVEGLFTGTDNQFAGSGVPASQIELVNAAYKTLSAAVDSKPAAADQVRYLCGELKDGRFTGGPLLDIADTFEERAAIRKLSLGTPDQMAANAKQARERLKRRFDAVTEAPNANQSDEHRKKVEELKTKILANPKDGTAKEALQALSAGGPTGPTGSDPERRLRIAELLLGINRGPEWQKKVALTVGLRTYQLAVSEQTSRLEAMTAQTRDARYADQQTFDVEYEQLKSLALENSKLVDQQTRVVDGLTKTLASDQALFAKRQTQLTELKNELAVLTTEVNKQLARQQKTEQELFAVQREVGLTLRETGKLESDLRDKEAPKK